MYQKEFSRVPMKKKRFQGSSGLPVSVTSENDAIMQTTMMIRRHMVSGLRVSDTLYPRQIGFVIPFREKGTKGVNRNRQRATHSIGAREGEIGSRRDQIQARFFFLRGSIPVDRSGVGRSIGRGIGKTTLGRPCRGPSVGTAGL